MREVIGYCVARTSDIIDSKHTVRYPNYINKDLGVNMRLAIILFILLAGCKSTPACEDDILAFVMSQDFIKRQLKSPSTANFPMINEPGVSVSRSISNGKCSFVVKTYVDAQNSFGGIARENFRVELQPDSASGQSWTLIEITSL